MKLQYTVDIPEDWEIFNVTKNTTVKIRPCEVVERFKVSWQDSELISDPEKDIIVIQPNGKEYPCKADIFYETYRQLTPNRNEWIKRATTQIVKIPEGVEVDIITLEGTLTKVSYPDYIAIGTKGELYANTKEFVENNLTIV